MKTDVCALLETNLDDVTPEVLGHVQSVLMESGALDVWLTPILMKKGRPAQMLSVLVKEERLDEFALRICRETGTLGVRVRSNAGFSTAPSKRARPNSGRSASSRESSTEKSSPKNRSSRTVPPPQNRGKFR